MGLANHHSASRVIQWCMKEGTDSDKAKLTSEVRANMVPLSKSKYGRHVVQKLINIAPKEEVPGGCNKGTLASLWQLFATEYVWASSWEGAARVKQQWAPLGQLGRNEQLGKARLGC